MIRSYSRSARCSGVSWLMSGARGGAPAGPPASVDGAAEMGVEPCMLAPSSTSVVALAHHQRGERDERERGDRPGQGAGEPARSRGGRRAGGSAAAVTEAGAGGERGRAGGAGRAGEGGAAARAEATRGRRAARRTARRAGAVGRRRER